MNMMTMFMPTQARMTVNDLMNDSGLEGEAEASRSLVSDAVVVDERDGVLYIGDISYKIEEPENPELVPDIVFFEIPSHTLILRSMLKDYNLGEHLLLMGNQGVGKNKLTDRLLQVMRRERDYIQLHRDTTVPTLTLNPSLEDGQIVWEDSPLVRAMSRGFRRRHHVARSRRRRPRNPRITVGDPDQKHRPTCSGRPGSRGRRQVSRAPSHCTGPQAPPRRPEGRRRRSSSRPLPGRGPS